MDSFCKAFNHGNVNIGFNQRGRKEIGMGKIRAEGCEKGGYEEEGKGYVSGVGGGVWDIVKF